MFEGAAASKALQPGLEVVANFDSVQTNARFGKPLKLASAAYRHGLFCHANSKIVVRLPAAGKTFEAIVGVDSNEQTAGGQGSVVFAVNVGGKRAYGSPLLREGMPALPVKVDLDGAKQFVLEIGDGGDGIGCDQADWADARITLADGQSIWLADLSMAGGPAVADPGNPPFSFVYDGQPSAEFQDWKLQRTSNRSTTSGPGGPSSIPIPRRDWWCVPWGSSTAISPRSSGPCTSRTRGRRQRRSSKRSRPSTMRVRSARHYGDLLHKQWAALRPTTMTAGNAFGPRRNNASARRRAADQPTAAFVLLQPERPAAA